MRLSIILLFALLAVACGTPAADRPVASKIGGAIAVDMQQQLQPDGRYLVIVTAVAKVASKRLSLVSGVRAGGTMELADGSPAPKHVTEAKDDQPVGASIEVRYYVRLDPPLQGEDGSEPEPVYARCFAVASGLDQNGAGIRGSGGLTVGAPVAEQPKSIEPPPTTRAEPVDDADAL
ncbi:MAG: hypothetical protein PF961_17880 [Planctomycetota bacterium]|nr:hypothetical protein [Planctomycetota bacterium]